MSFLFYSIGRCVSLALPFWCMMVISSSVYLSCCISRAICYWFEDVDYYNSTRKIASYSMVRSADAWYSSRVDLVALSFELLKKLLSFKDLHLWFRVQCLSFKNLWPCFWTRFFPFVPGPAIVQWYWQCTFSFTSSPWLIFPEVSFFFWATWSRLQGRSWSMCFATGVR